LPAGAVGGSGAIRSGNQRGNRNAGVGSAGDRGNASAALEYFGQAVGIRRSRAQICRGGGERNEKAGLGNGRIRAVSNAESVAVPRGNQASGGYAGLRGSDGDDRRDVAGSADVNLWGDAVRCNVGDEIGRQRNERDVFAIRADDRIIARSVPGGLAVGGNGNELRVETGARRNRARSGGGGHADRAPIHLARAVLYRDGRYQICCQRCKGRVRSGGMGRRLGAWTVGGVAIDV